MAEQSHEKLQNQEHIEQSQAKEAKTSQEKLSKAELAKQEQELARKGELAKEKLEAEKRKQEALNDKPKKVDTEADKTQKTYTKAQQKAHYKSELKKVRAQLPRTTQVFSKFVHNPAVEKVSDVAGKTVLRPSILIGGAVTALILGIVVYVVAKQYSYMFPSDLLVLLLIVGAIIGLLIELVLKKLEHKTLDQ